jgi:hypothetical protein
MSGAVGRRGNTVVVLRLHDAAGTPDPRNIQWLLATAVSRLPADRARRAVPSPPHR